MSLLFTFFILFGIILIIVAPLVSRVVVYGTVWLLVAFAAFECLKTVGIGLCWVFLLPVELLMLTTIHSWSAVWQTAIASGTAWVCSTVVWTMLGGGMAYIAAIASAEQSQVPLVPGGPTADEVITQLRADTAAGYRRQVPASPRAHAAALLGGQLVAPQQRIEPYFSEPQTLLTVDRTEDQGLNITGRINNFARPIADGTTHALRGVGIGLVASGVLHKLLDRRR